MKKNATPRKAARKAPVRTKTSPKKVTAPVRHKPKGSPKERLAYLNRGEMAALEKRKGSPARRGPKGLPSFADDSASSKGVSRGDKSGTKGSGSTKTATGSVSKGGSYNSGTSGSKGGGASTQSPGMGRNEGRVGPSSPMGGQGASFKTPEKAKKANESYTDRYGFQNRVNSRLPSAIKDIEDIRGRMGPFKGPLKDGLMPDKAYGPFDPNRPFTNKDQEDFIKSYMGKRDALARRVVSDRASNALGGMQNTRSGPRRPSNDMRTPQEVREQAARFNDEMGRADAEADREYYGYDKQTFGTGLRANIGRAQASGMTPDVKVGVNRAGRASFKAGGLVKKKSNKTFKKK